MIKAWWGNLNERERKTVLIGSVVFILLMGYLLIWSPMRSAVTERKASVESQLSLLSYLNNASVAISRIKQGQEQAPTDNQNITSQAENTFAAQGLSSTLKEVGQVSPTEVTFTFEQTNFDHLMQAVYQLAESNINVISMNAEKTSNGLANVKVTLAS